MAMLLRVVSRATQPHLPSLADALRPLLAAAGANLSFHLRWQDGKVVIEQNSFTGVDWPEVEAAVAAAPEHSDKLDAKALIDNWDIAQKAFARLVVKQFNVLRQNPVSVLAPITEQQFYDAMKAEIDSL